MCGIIGYVGNQEAVPILIGGLSKLEYRGYDSSGVAVLQGEKIAVRRSVGKLVNLQNSLKANGLKGTVGIGHTRWATHGKPSEQNAHPHRSKGCVLVHNGIIENYQQLKQQLERDGYKFESETDTEVVAHLIDKYLQRGGSLAEAVRLATKDVRGSYALAVISEREPGTLIAARSGCPLVVGRTQDASYVASDVMAMLTHTRDVTYLEEGDVAVVTQYGVNLTDATLIGHFLKKWGDRSPLFVCARSDALSENGSAAFYKAVVFTYLKLSNELLVTSATTKSHLVHIS